MQQSQIIGSPEFNVWFDTFQTEFALECFECSGTHCVYMTEYTDLMKDAINKCIPPPTTNPEHNNDLMSCRSCRSSLETIIRLRDANGNPFFMPGDMNTYPECFHPLWLAARDGTIVEIIVADPEVFKVYQTGIWTHFSIKTSTKLTNENLDIKKKLLKKYVGLMFTSFAKNGVSGIQSSMDSFISVLPTVTYGDKLIASARWFRKHIVDNFCNLSLPAKLRLIGNAIFDLESCVEAGSGDVSLPLYHQLTGNVLDALEYANDIPALKNILQERLSPLNYQVKTAEAKDGQIDMAIKLIGDFSVKLMTVEASYKYGAIKIGLPSSALSTFNSMKKTKENSSKAAGFATRATSYIGRCSNTKLTTLNTMDALLANLPADLEVLTTSQTPVYANEWTLKEGVAQTDFTWNFANGNSPAVFGMSGWHKVIAILPMMRNYLLICEGAKCPVFDKMSVGCHVGLLTSSYNKSCGTAFGNLNLRMTLEIPNNGPYAIGIGTSKTGEESRLVRPLVLRSGTQEFTVL